MEEWYWKKKKKRLLVTKIENKKWQCSLDTVIHDVSCVAACMLTHNESQYFFVLY
jgi:hypothetical protein